MPFGDNIGTDKWVSVCEFVRSCRYTVPWTSLDENKALLELRPSMDERAILSSTELAAAVNYRADRSATKGVFPDTSAQ